MLLAEIIAVPRVDPIGLPAHPVLFVALLLLTQFLHLLFMNFVLGGSLIAVGLNVAGLRGRGRAGAMARVIYSVLPVVISMAITFGVAPLLFVQVLYGQYFYSSNVLMGFGWFSFFVAVLLGFYMVYWLLYRGFGASRSVLDAADRRPALRLLVSMLATACFLWVAWIMANNHELTIRPALWRASGFGGSRWYTPASTTLPRYLHDVIGATAVAGLWLTGIGWWRARRASETPDVDQRLIALGLRVASLATMLQIGVGVWFLFRLDAAVRAELLSFRSVLGTAWIVSLAAVMALFGLLVLASAQPAKFKWFAASAATAMVVIVGMLMGREHVRQVTLALPQSGGFELKSWSAHVYPQYGSLAVFAVLLVAGLATVGVMLRWVLLSPHSPDSPPGLAEQLFADRRESGGLSRSAAEPAAAGAKRGHGLVE